MKFTFLITHQAPGINYPTSFPSILILEHIFMMESLDYGASAVKPGLKLLPLRKFGNLITTRNENILYYLETILSNNLL